MWKVKSVSIFLFYLSCTIHFFYYCFWKSTSHVIFVIWISSSVIILSCQYIWYEEVSPYYMIYSFESIYNYWSEKQVIYRCWFTHLWMYWMSCVTSPLSASLVHWLHQSSGDLNVVETDNLIQDDGFHNFRHWHVRLLSNVLWPGLAIPDRFSSAFNSMMILHRLLSCCVTWSRHIISDD